MRNPRCLVWLAFLILLGCGSDDTPELAIVSGSLTRSGKPVVNGWVEFHPTSGRPSAGRTDENGMYSLVYSNDLRGAVLGSHQIKVGIGGEDVEDPNAQGGYRTTPREAFDYQMTVVVDSGDNVIDIQVP